MRLHALDQLVHPMRLKDVVLVVCVAFVVDLDEHVSPAARQQEVSRGIDCPQNRRLVPQAFILALVEVAENDDHCACVGRGDRPLGTVSVLLPETSVGCKRRVFPGLLARVALRAAALEIEG